MLEARNGDLVGVEIKASAQVAPSDFRGLRFLRDNFPDRFRAGVVFHSGATTVSFAPDLHAVPSSALWASPEVC